MIKEKYDSSNFEAFIKARRIARLLTAKLNEESHNDRVVINESLIDDDCIMGTLHELSDENKLEVKISEFQIIESEKMIHAHNLKTILNNAQSKKRNEGLGVKVKWLSIVAVIITISFLIYFVDKDSTLAEVTTYVIDHSIVEQVVNPTLVLGNGESVDLVAIQKDTIRKNIILKNKQLTYTDQLDSVCNKVTYNTLIIPAGRTYTLMLSDSTEVFLNANSTLCFPNIFNKDSIRVVNLSGEGYFNVKKNGQPFIVRCDVGDIVVSGTEFNVNAYNKNSMTAVLISGIIGVDLLSGKDNIMLKPNEILHVDMKANAEIIKNGNINRYISWKRGYFRRDNESLISLLEEISSWYNIKFSYANKKLSSINVTASLRMITEVEMLLSSIEILADVKFIKEKGGDYRIE